MATPSTTQTARRKHAAARDRNVMVLERWMAESPAIVGFFRSCKQDVFQRRSERVLGHLKLTHLGQPRLTHAAGRRGRKLKRNPRSAFSDDLCKSPALAAAGMGATAWSGAARPGARPREQPDERTRPSGAPRWRQQL